MGGGAVAWARLSRAIQTGAQASADALCHRGCARIKAWAELPLTFCRRGCPSAARGGHLAGCAIRGAGAFDSFCRQLGDWGPGGEIFCFFFYAIRAHGAFSYRERWGRLSAGSAADWPRVRDVACSERPTGLVGWAGCMPHAWPGVGPLVDALLRLGQVAPTGLRLTGRRRPGKMLCGERERADDPKAGPIAKRYTAALVATQLPPLHNPQAKTAALHLPT